MYDVVAGVGRGGRSVGSVNRDVTEATGVLTCRDLTHSSELQTVSAATSVSAGDAGRRGAAVFAGAVLTVVGVAGLHGLYRAGGDPWAWGVWVVALLAGMTALGGGIKLITWGIKPVIAAVSAAGKERFSESVQAVAASGAVIAGALGMWWTLRGGYSTWWQHLSGEPSWTLLLGIGQMLVAVLAGAALFTGGKYLAGLAKDALTDAGMLGARVRTPIAEGVGAQRNESRKKHDESLWHPGLLAALIGGGAGLVLLAAGITPRLYVWITGPNVLPAVAAIAATLAWGIGSNLGWWKGLAGLYTWATDASQKATATAGVIAVLMFSASGLGLGWFTPATVPQAHAQCPPDCGGGSNGTNSYGPDASQFQPPQMPNQMPDYQGGINQPPMDQNSSISIYNTQAPSISNNGAQGSSGQQGPQQGWDQPAHGTQIPDYQNATPYTQGPGKPNPDFNPGSQGGQANQGAQSGNQSAQQPQQQPPQNQPPQNNTGQQPDQQSPNQSDQQRLDELTRQLQDQQQQSTQDRQRLDDLTKQLQQQGQQKQNGNQKLPKAPSKDKKKDDKDQQQDQSGNNDLSALLMGAASTRRRKQDDQQPQPDQQQGPDTQALAQDGAQLSQSLPGDIANTVSDSVNLGQSAGSAAQNFGSAAQAGASLASSAQSGAVNPMDAVALVQGVSGGISDTADAVGSGASIASTWLNEAGQGAQLAADANPQLKPQAQQVQQLTQAGGQVADLTGQVAGGVSQVSGIVNTASSLGTSGMPDTSGATDALSGTATAVNGPGDVPKPPTPPTPQSSGVQALDSTKRAPQQPPQPVAPAQPQAPKAASPTSTPKPLSPLAASSLPPQLQALNSAYAAATPQTSSQRLLSSASGDPAEPSSPTLPGATEPKPQETAPVGSLTSNLNQVAAGPPKGSSWYSDPSGAANHVVDGRTAHVISPQGELSTYLGPNGSPVRLIQTPGSAPSMNLGEAGTLTNLHPGENGVLQGVLNGNPVTLLTQQDPNGVLSGFSVRGQTGPLQTAPGGKVEYSHQSTPVSNYDASGKWLSDTNETATFLDGMDNGTAIDTITDPVLRADSGGISSWVHQNLPGVPNVPYDMHVLTTDGYAGRTQLGAVLDTGLAASMFTPAGQAGRAAWLGRGGAEAAEQAISPVTSFATKADFTAVDIDNVAAHLSRMDPFEPNDAMISRIRDAISQGAPLSDTQVNFMRHELTENGLMKQGMDYEAAHAEALMTHPPGKNYDLDLIQENPLFGRWWKQMNGLLP